MNFREIKTEEINKTLFANSQRHQVVTKCWRKVADVWIIKDVPFIDEWNEEEYSKLVCLLKNTVSTGGLLYGAFSEVQMKGFASVEPAFFGRNGDYLDLSAIHVSEDIRGQGVGKILFRIVADWAKCRGARKLYISAHSAVETQAFYRAMGCVEAEEYNAEHVAKEPCDCQLEYCL